MSWRSIGYAALCVIVPSAWGMIVVWVSRQVEKRVLQQGRRKGKSDEQATMPPLDYHI